MVLIGKGAATDFPAACARYDLVILPAALDPSLLADGPCLRIDRDILNNTGALGGDWRDDTLTLYPSRNAARIWSGDRPVLKPIIVTAAERMATQQPQ